MRLIVALSLSLFGHGVTGLCAYSLLNAWPVTLLAVFQAGESGITVSLVGGNEGTAGSVDELRPAPVATTKPDPVVPPASPPPEAAEEAPRAAVAQTLSPPDSPAGPPDSRIAVAQVREEAQAAAGTRSPAQGAEGTEAGHAGEALSKGVGSGFVGLDKIRPRYPLGARMRGEQGVTTVRVVVNARGRAEKTEIVQSSGFSSLDRAAIEAVKEAQFVAEGDAASQGGEAVLSFRFKLVD